MKVGVHQGSVLSPLVFATVVDVVMESVRNGLMSEMLYAEGEVSVSKVDPCGICGKRAMVLCVKCGKWIHGRCAKVKRVHDLEVGERFCVWKMQEAS